VVSVARQIAVRKSSPSDCAGTVESQ
jgi:hypothetical protein